MFSHGDTTVMVILFRGEAVKPRPSSSPRHTPFLPHPASSPCCPPAVAALPPAMPPGTLPTPSSLSSLPPPATALPRPPSSPLPSLGGKLRAPAMVPLPRPGPAASATARALNRPSACPPSGQPASSVRHLLSPRELEKKP